MIKGQVVSLIIDKDTLPGLATLTPFDFSCSLENLLSEGHTLKRMLHTEGALLVRGFNIDTTSKFKIIANIFANDLRSDNGEHNQIPEADDIYTPVHYAEQERLLWHNENSFNLSWPLMIMFAAVVPAAKGGETPIVDSRRVLAELDQNVVEEFVRKGVMYVRTHGFGFGRSWQETYHTQNKIELEEKCKANDIQMFWHGPERLVTKQVRPAIARHPITHELSWFNQAQHWHPYCLASEVRKYLFELFDQETIPRNCLFGDGSIIPDEVMQHILDVYEKLEISFLWEKGDVMVLDNILFAHGRKPYSGSRKLLVTMGNYHSFNEYAKCL